MDEEPEKPQDQTKLPPEPLKLTADSTEYRLKVLERIHDKMFTMVQWGFGAIATLALALLAGNIYTSHSNYERDNATLNQDVANIAKQLDLENEKKLFDLRTAAESSFITISNNLENQLTAIIKANDANWANISKLLTTNITGLDSAIKTEVFVYMTNNLNAVDTNISTEFDSLRAVLEKQSDSAMASSLLVQANNTERKTNRGKHFAYHDYIMSAAFYLRAGDEDNASQATKNLIDSNQLQAYLFTVSKDEYKIHELQRPLSDALDELIRQLKTLNATGRYADELKTLEYCNNLIIEKLSK